MSLQDILSTDTSRRPRRRIGRGIGSGMGKTGGRGAKGEGSRTGGKNRTPLFEGGQMKFWMRLPKRGFSNFVHRTDYVAIRLADAIKRVTGDAISAASLQAAGLISNGELAKLVSGAGVAPGRKFTVTVKATASARQAIEAAGGTVQAPSGTDG